MYTFLKILKLCIHIECEQSNKGQHGKASEKNVEGSNHRLSNLWINPLYPWKMFRGGLRGVASVTMPYGPVTPYVVMGLEWPHITEGLFKDTD